MSASAKPSLRSRLAREHLLSRGLCSIYIVLFSLIHILFFHNGFFDINRCKYSLLAGSAAIVFGAFVLFYLAERLFTDEAISQPPAKALSPGAAGALVLLFAAAVSVCLSEDPLAALTGSGGRYAGGLFIGACLALYLFGLWAHVPRKAVVAALSISGSLCALLGILNFLHIDPLGFYVASLKPIYHDDFISTIGNINFFSAYMCLIAGLGAGCFVRSEGRRSAIWLAVYALGCMGVLVSRSESGMIGLACIFLGLCLFAPRSMHEAGRACALPCAFCLSVVLIGQLCIWRGGDHMTLYEGIARTLLHHPRQISAAAFLSFGMAVLLYTRRETPANVRRLRIFLRCVLIAALLCLGLIVALMYHYTCAAPNVPLDGALAYLRMDDYWGTFRGFIWKKTVSLYAGLPLLQKLFGIGPDCLKALLVKNCYNEMVRLTGILFDNAHNEYLQYLITTGALGLCGYLLMLGGALRSLWQRVQTDPMLLGCALALCAHCVQAFFNIAQPETTPAVFLLLALCSRREK